MNRRRVEARRAQGAVEVLAWPLAAVVLVALVAVVGEASSPTSEPRAVAVSQSVTSCPVAGGLTAATGQVEAGSGGSIRTVTGEEDTTVELDPAAWVATAGTGDSAVVRQMGGGGVAFVAGTLPVGDGYTVAACPGVADESWFLGAGTTARHPSTLVLTNIADVPAQVDVELWGGAGRIDAVNDTGIVVQPGATAQIPLADLVVGEAEVAVHVVRRRGVVTAAVVDASTTALAGSEVLTASGPPATETVLPGVAAAGGRTLLLANPGERAAGVSVTAAGPEGGFVPEGLGELEVPAGTVLPVALPESVGAEATGLRVESDEPVLSTVRLAASEKDYAYASGRDALTGPAVVPVALGPGAVRPVLHLLADDETSAVDVELFDAAMQSVGSTSVTVERGTLTAIDLASPEITASPDVAYAVVTAKRPVHGAAVYRTGDLISVLTLREAPLEALGPRVRPGF